MRRTLLASILVLLVLMNLPSISGKDEPVQEQPVVLPHVPIIFDGSTFNGTNPEGVIGNGTMVDPFIITGHWINTSHNVGIEIRNSSSHLMIQTCLLTNKYQQNFSGIRIVNSSNVWIDNVYTYYAVRGIEVIESRSIQIFRSGLFGCMDGIYVQGENIRITECLMKVNVKSGIFVNNSENVLIENVISDGNTAILGVTSGIHVLDSDRVRIINATCSLNYGYGVLVDSSNPMEPLEEIEILDSYIDSNNNGMMIINTIRSKVRGTVIQHNTNGIYLTDSEGFNVEGSSFKQNTYGIFMSDSQDIMIDGSQFHNNENAIYLDSTNSTTVKNSLFTNGTWHAITIDTWLDLGPDSSNNLVYGNEFRDNGPRGTQVMDNGVDNLWHLDEIGNTWHDHYGPDEDNDTIVDEPYMIDGLANASDPYPKALDKVLIIDDVLDEPADDRKMPGENYWIIFGATGALLVILLISILFIKKDE